MRAVIFTRGVVYVVSVGAVPAAISDELICEIYARMDETGTIRHAAASILEINLAGAPQITNIELKVTSLIWVAIRY